MSAVVEPPVEAVGDAAEEGSTQGMPGAAEGFSVWPELKERVIGLRTMAPPLRALALLAIGVLVAAFVLGLLGHARLPETTISAGGVGPIRLPVPVLVLILLAFGLAWCYAITATLFIHPLLRLAILCVFTLTMLDQGTLFTPALESARSALLVAALVLAWVIVGANAVAVRRDRGTVGRWSAPALFALTALIQVLAWWSSHAAKAPGIFALGFVLELTVFAILVTVYLSSAGGEFAQVADLICGAAAEQCARRSKWLMAAAAAVVAGVLLLRALVGAPSGLVWNVALGLVAAAVVVAVCRARSKRAGVTRLPSWATLLTGAVIAGALIVSSALATPGVSQSSRFLLTPPTLVYQHASAPSFSIAYPPGWNVRSVVKPAGTSEFELSGEPAGVNSIGELLAFHRTDGGSARFTGPQALALVRQAETVHFSGHTVVVAPTASAYRYSLGVAVGNRLAIIGRVGLFWTPRYVWVVHVIANPLWWTRIAAVAGYMVNSWRPNAGAQPVDLSPAAPVRTSTAYFGAIGLGLAAVLALLLVIAPLPPKLAAAARCVFVAALLMGLVNLREAAGLITGHYRGGVPHLNMRAVELVVALAIAGALALSLTASPHRRRATAALPRLAILGGTTLALSLLFSLYSDAAVATLTVTGVTFLLGAFLWDVALSGDVVNGDGKRIRRPGRVLLYMSFLLATSAATLYFASARNLGTLKAEDAFGPEAQAALSVFFVGIAWATVTCLSRFGRRRADAPAEPPPEEPAQAEPAPVGAAAES